jgi:hypothetical protein
MALCRLITSLLLFNSNICRREQISLHQHTSPHLLLTVMQEKGSKQPGGIDNLLKTILIAFKEIQSS